MSKSPGDAVVVPTTTLKQPVLVRLMVCIALIVLPVIAWVDFQQGLRFSAAVESVAAVALLILAASIKSLGPKRAIRLTLLVMFVLVALGSIEKLGSTPNFAWFTVMPFLYISIGGLRLGGGLAVAHFVFIAACYWIFGQNVLATIDPGTWVQVGLAYATAAGLAISYEHGQRQLRMRLRALAEHDPLTELLNRRGMEKRLRELSSFLNRNHMVVTLALLDIDHFKRVNDRFGHDVGDAVLAEIGRELKRVFRSSDYLARWGGDEFLIALTNTHIEEARSVLDRLRTEVAEASDALLPSITMSIGAAEWHPDTEFSATLKQADVALYRAKERGRNELVIAAPEKHLCGTEVVPAVRALP